MDTFRQKERARERQEGKVISKKFVILRAQKCLHKRIEIDEEKKETTTSTANTKFFDTEKTPEYGGAKRGEE